MKCHWVVLGSRMVFVFLVFAGTIEGCYQSHNDDKDMGAYLMGRTPIYSPLANLVSHSTEPDLPVYIGQFVSTVGDIHFSKIMFNNRILSSNDMFIIDDILDGEFGYHWSSSCEYSFWVIKEANLAPDKFAPLTRSDPFVAKVQNSALLDNATRNLGMSYEEFKELIETDVIDLPMLEDEDSVATALTIMGTSSSGGLQSGVPTDEGSESFGDG